MNQREKDLFFELIELTRKQINLPSGNVDKVDFSTSDWKDADDWLFSELSLTKDELAEIYEGRNTMVYTASAMTAEQSRQETAERIFHLIGEYYGPEHGCKDGLWYIDTQTKVHVYRTLEALFEDWTDTLLDTYEEEGGFEEEIGTIYTDILELPPCMERCDKGYAAFFYSDVGSRHKEYVGRFEKLPDAMLALRRIRELQMARKHRWLELDDKPDGVIGSLVQRTGKGGYLVMYIDGLDGISVRKCFIDMEQIGFEKREEADAAIRQAGYDGFAGVIPEQAALILAKAGFGDESVVRKGELCECTDYLVRIASGWNS